MEKIKRYAAVFYFTPHLPHQVLIRAENEEQAVMSLYYTAFETFCWPKERVTVRGIWTMEDVKHRPGGVTDNLRQKRKEKKYSVPYEYIEKNIFKIKCRMGTVVDHGILSSLMEKENIERIEKKAARGLL